MLANNLNLIAQHPVDSKLDRKKVMTASDHPGICSLKMKYYYPLFLVIIFHNAKTVYTD